MSQLNAAASVYSSISLRDCKEYFPMIHDADKCY